MGENEQGGMLRTVVVIGIVAMVALIVTLGVVGLKNNMTTNQTNALQTVSKGVTQKDIDFKLTGDNGQLTSLTSKTNLVNEAYLANVVSGNNTKADTNYLMRPYEPLKTNTHQGIWVELYVDSSKINYFSENSPGDYYELSIDYKVVDGQSVTFDQAKALNLDSQKDGDSSFLRIGLRSGAGTFSRSDQLKLDGTKKGTLTTTVSKSGTGSVYDVYVLVSNTNFKHLELSNLRISNASH